MALLWAFLMSGCALYGQALEGTVVNARSGQPISGVAVTVETPGRGPYKSSTDPQGSFRIPQIAPGNYSANFTHSDFLPPTESSKFQIGAGRDALRLQIALMPYSKVTGRVVDPDGKGVHRAELVLDSAHIGTTQTSDEQGNFSFDAVPGSYTLSARPPGTLKPPPPEPNTDERLGWAKTYYPSVLDPRAAAKIVVRAGVDSLGQDIRLRTLPVRRLRGIVLDSRGDPAPRVSVNATASGEAFAEDITVVAGDDGRFEFPALYDAEWRISSALKNGSLEFRAFAAVQIPGRDVEGVQLLLQPPFSIPGSIAVNGPGVLKFDQRLGIYLRPNVNGPDGRNEGLPGPDGSFTIRDVYPGLYQIITVSTPSPPYFLSSIKLGDLEVLGRFVEFQSGAVPIKVTYDSDGGSIRGTVENCGNATVVLLSAERQFQTPSFVQTAHCGEAGRVDFPSIRPADYYAFAVDNYEGAAELISSLDQTLLNTAVTVHVRRGETATVELRVIKVSP